MSRFDSQTIEKLIVERLKSLHEEGFTWLAQNAFVYDVCSALLTAPEHVVAPQLVDWLPEEAAVGRGILALVEVGRIKRKIDDRHNEFVIRLVSELEALASA